MVNMALSQYTECAITVASDHSLQLSSKFRVTFKQTVYSLLTDLSIDGELNRLKLTYRHVYIVFLPTVATEPYHI